MEGECFFRGVEARKWSGINRLDEKNIVVLNQINNLRGILNEILMDPNPREIGGMG